MGSFWSCKQRLVDSNVGQPFMSNIELTVVAARRNALLRDTLNSFHARMFRNFRFDRVSVNIDPLWGDQKEESECVATVKSLFPNAVIYTPEKANHCSAVKRLWTNSQSQFLFHMEDDWNLLENIDPSILNLFSDPKIAQVSLMTKEKNWARSRRGDFHFVKRRPKLFGIIPSPFRKTIPAFTTSPSFIRGDFARHWAHLLDEAFDPEKQGYSQVNAPLERFTANYRNYIYSGKHFDNLIIDTGRDWRAARHIEKIIVEGKATWASH